MLKNQRFLSPKVDNKLIKTPNIKYTKGYYKVINWINSKKQYITAR